MTSRCQDCKACDTCAEIEDAEERCAKAYQAMRDAIDEYNAECRHRDLVLAQVEEKEHAA